MFLKYYVDDGGMDLGTNNQKTIPMASAVTGAEPYKYRICSHHNLITYKAFTIIRSRFFCKHWEQKDTKSTKRFRLRPVEAEHEEPV